MPYSSQRYLGGLGGLFLLAEPGPLSVTILKRDRHDGDRDTALRAILLGPDRRPLDEIEISGDGSALLQTTVEHTGVYAVQVTAAYDRYGEAVWWGFRTNCPRFLIETSRGHRDARHVEPIVVGPPLDGQEEGAFDICFLPTDDELEIKVSGLPQGDAPILLTAQDDTLTRIEAVDGAATHVVPADSERNEAPWTLRLPSTADEVLIDGLTQWDRGHRWDNLSLWTTVPERFFPLHDLRWALTPYRHAFNAPAGATRTIELRLHNNGAHPDTLELTVDPTGLMLELSISRVALQPGESSVVTATASLPPDATDDSTLSARVILSSERHADVVTWSTIEARVRTEAEALPALDLPLVYRPYEQENAQFGYTPDYPLDNQPYFDAGNRPLILGRTALHRMTGDGDWEQITTAPFRTTGSKVAFGANGEICLLANSQEGPAYLLSEDGGASFLSHTLPTAAAPTQTDIEQFAGHNQPAGPAPFIVATRRQDDKDEGNFWRRVNDLALYLPSVDDGELHIGDPIPVSNQAIGISSHSGIPSALASVGDSVHVIWGEATDPDVDVPGVPAYVTTYDRTEDRWLGEPALVGYGPPANDVHNTPSIVIDSQGFLHTLTGTHGSPFAYARSLEPHTAHAGFTEPVLVEQDLRSTYVGLVCGPDDTLHLVFRAWRSDGVYHPHSHYAVLGYKRKPVDGPWEPTQLLAVAPFSEYSIWYHRLTIDRRGNLFVSFDYWSTFWFYRTDHVGNRRKTITSADGGDSWRLVRSHDLLQ